jgi:DNA mismatch repair protein MSH5
LYEQVVDTFIPNDAYLVGGVGVGVHEAEQDAEQEETSGGMLDQVGRSVLVVTGANACGKVRCLPHWTVVGKLITTFADQSVYLKQVALIQYMAQVAHCCFCSITTRLLIPSRSDGED